MPSHTPRQRAATGAHYIPHGNKSKRFIGTIKVLDLPEWDNFRDRIALSSVHIRLL